VPAAQQRVALISLAKIHELAGSTAVNRTNFFLAKIQEVTAAQLLIALIVSFNKCM
jgi:hypothetical protein